MIGYWAISAKLSSKSGREIRTWVELTRSETWQAGYSKEWAEKEIEKKYAHVFKN